MADLTITAANVKAGSNSKIQKFQSGATITRGEQFYLDSTDSNKAKLAVTSSEAAAETRGVCLQDAVADDYFVGVVLGKYDAGATTVVGRLYVVSDTAGAIAEYNSTHPGTGDYVSILGRGAAGNQIDISPIHYGVAHG